MRRQVTPTNALILHHIEVLMLKSSIFVPSTEKKSVLGTGSTSMIENYWSSRHHAVTIPGTVTILVVKNMLEN